MRLKKSGEKTKQVKATDLWAQKNILLHYGKNVGFDVFYDGASLVHVDLIAVLEKIMETNHGRFRVFIAMETSGCLFRG